MGKKRDIICITCPKGCRAKVWREEGAVRITGKICKEGKAYLRQEFIEPMRILTSTVVVDGSPRKRLPVRTAGPIPKKDLFASMEALARVRVRPPLEMGQVIIPDIARTGVDVIASDDLPA